MLEYHGLVRAGLKMMLDAESSIKVVAQAANRWEALEIAERERPDIFLVDIKLGDQFAADFLPQLLSCSKRCRVILITSITDKDLLCHAVHAGARGLVSKEDAPEMLIRAIHKVHSGELWLPRGLMDFALSRALAYRGVNPSQNPEAARIASLTPREREIVALIASGVNRKSAAERLFVSETTIRNHLSSILKKLNLANQFELVFYAQRNGLSSSAEPERD